MSLTDRWEQTQRRVLQATKNARLVAVSKLHSPQSVQVLLENTSQRDFGENYAQELIDKAMLLPDVVRWHMIGAVQSNKCHKLAAIPNLVRVSSICSEKLAVRLNEECAKIPRKLGALVQVNTSGEESKSGVNPEDAIKLADFIEAKCPALTFEGFMTIGHTTDRLKTAQGFLKLSEIKNAQEAKLKRTLELSMGMSGDLEIAGEYGTTEVRVGADIFGPRPPATS